MNTVVGRTLYRLFAENLFVSAITIHGGANVIAYNWGSNNHLKGKNVGAEAPDHQAMHLLGQAMVDAAGGDILIPNSNIIERYELGDSTSTVYPVGGSFEDWAYAAGWDFGYDATLDSCTP